MTSGDGYEDSNMTEDQYDSLLEEIEILPESATFTSLMDKAEEYTMQDAIAAAQAQNTEGAALSQLAIEANYISERTSLYTQALEYYRSTEAERGAQGMAEIENQSGYSLGDIENGIETMALQSGELQIRIASDAPIREDQPVNPDTLPDTLEIASMDDVGADDRQYEQSGNNPILGMNT